MTDPSTGKVVSAPEYGGTITFSRGEEPAGPDAVIQWCGGGISSSQGVLEKLAIAGLGNAQGQRRFRVSPPSNSHEREPGGKLGYFRSPTASPIPSTVRQGVHWHDKPPMSGRELTADDIVYNYHRLLGLGSGFTEPAEQGTEFKSFGVQFESIEATDKWTVVFKLKELNLAALFQILDSSKTVHITPRGNQGTR